VGEAEGEAEGATVVGEEVAGEAVVGAAVGDWEGVRVEGETVGVVSGEPVGRVASEAREKTFWELTMVFSRGVIATSRVAAAVVVRVQVLSWVRAPAVAVRVSM
jgi:hypothetical protein